MTDTEFTEGTYVIFLLRGQERRGKIEAFRENGVAVSFRKQRTSARQAAGRSTALIHASEIVKAV